MTAPPAPGSLLKETDLEPNQFFDFVSLAADLKAAKAERRENPRLTGRNIALVFQKASTRTRCAFEVAAFDQGARVTYLGPEGSHLGRDESIADTARVLGRMYDGIEFRGFAQDTVEELAAHAGVPVWNGLTDEWHPTQMLADILTMTEYHAGPIGEVCYCFLGDGRNNVARSLLVTGALLGMDVRIGAPAALQPPVDVVGIAQELADRTGARLMVTDDVPAAVTGTDFLYTDVWVSMGESDEQWAARVPQLLPYRVTPEVMALSGKSSTRFMHCLPSIHGSQTEIGRRVFERFGIEGCEVSNDVFESRQSVVFDQAENRLHTIKAVMVNALAD
jgi:ornithine carbamoyltransferase